MHGVHVDCNSRSSIVIAIMDQNAWQLDQSGLSTGNYPMIAAKDFVCAFALTNHNWCEKAIQQNGFFESFSLLFGEILRIALERN